ncbi:MAG: acylneuraminate cytidylyltransferase family protein [Maricaulis sp.]|nr:acylneuraminate cytidylyltransferase family protein [Maricaulis sp.]
MDHYGLVALLPMKAHSARVKSKNFREFAGKPLFRWILDSLLDVDEVDRVVINTDAREILTSHGLNDGDANGRVMIRERKPEICGDLVSMNLVLGDDVAAVSADTYLMTHTTNPLLRPESIGRALSRYHRETNLGTADSLFSVNGVQTRFYRNDMTPVNHDPDNLLRTQDLETWYEENSNLYIFDRKSFEKTGARIGVQPCMHETPPLESVDIDNSDQWAMAEALAFYRDSKRAK